MVLWGTHYPPFALLDGMRIVTVLAALLVGSGLITAMYWSRRFRAGAWYTGATRFVFARLERAIAHNECREKLPTMSLPRTGGPQRAFSL